MKKTFAMGLSIVMVLALFSGCGNAETGPTDGGASDMPKVEENTETGDTVEPETSSVTFFCDGTAGYKLELEERDAGYSGELYFQKYFGEDVAAGMQALVEAEAVTVNGLTIPTVEGDKCTVIVNGLNKLAAIKNLDADSTPAEAAVLALGELLKSSGTQVTLTLEDSKVTRMELFYTEGILVDHLEETEDGILIYRSKESVFIPGASTGFMQNPEHIKEAAFDEANVEDVTENGIAAFWQGPDGWHIKGAEAVKGHLVDGADHEFYVLEDENGNTMEYVDAAMYSRGFSDGSRPGQFTNTQMNFELNDIPVTVWFIPGTVATDNPMPIGITSMDNARPRLERAMEYVQSAIDHTVVADDEEGAKAIAQSQGLGDDFHWITEEVSVEHTSEITGKSADGVLDMLEQALVDAQAVLDDPDAAPATLDQETYELFIAMWGSSSDIGALFRGSVKEGYFDVADAGAHALPAAVLN